MDDVRRVIHDAIAPIKTGEIRAVGPGLAADDADILDLGGCVVTPGLITAHHHLFRSLTRAVAAALVLAGARQVRDPLADGRDVARNSRHLTLDLQARLSRALKAVRRLSA